MTPVLDAETVAVYRAERAAQDAFHRLYGPSAAQPLGPDNIEPFARETAAACGYDLDVAFAFDADLIEGRTGWVEPGVLHLSPLASAWLVLHELGHVLAPSRNPAIEDHGPAFRAVHVALVTGGIARQAGDLLRHHYDQMQAD
jgi:hypothetical protein